MSTIRHRLRPLARQRKTLRPTRRDYSRLLDNDDARVETRRLSGLKKATHFAAKGLRYLFLQAKFLIPIEAEAVECWMV